jgi:hypothetical protein
VRCLELLCLRLLPARGPALYQGDHLIPRLVPITPDLFLRLPNALLLVYRLFFSGSTFGSTLLFYVYGLVNTLAILITITKTIFLLFLH